MLNKRDMRSKSELAKKPSVALESIRRKNLTEEERQICVDSLIENISWTNPCKEFFNSNKCREEDWQKGLNRILTHKHKFVVVSYLANLKKISLEDQLKIVNHFFEFKDIDNEVYNLLRNYPYNLHDESKMLLFNKLLENKENCLSYLSVKKITKEERPKLIQSIFNDPVIVSRFISNCLYESKEEFKQAIEAVINSKKPQAAYFACLNVNSTRGKGFKELKNQLMNIYINSPKTSFDGFSMLSDDLKLKVFKKYKSYFLQQCYYFRSYYDRYFEYADYMVDNKLINGIIKRKEYYRATEILEFSKSRNFKLKNEYKDKLEALLISAKLCNN